MARTGILLGLLLVALPGPCLADNGKVGHTAGARLSAAAARAVSPLRFAQLYWKERSARQVGKLQRQAEALTWRVTLTTLNPWSRRGINDQIADCRKASQLRDQASGGLRAARVATLARAQRAGITAPRRVLQRWGLQAGASPRAR